MGPGVLLDKAGKSFPPMWRLLQLKLRGEDFAYMTTKMELCGILSALCKQEERSGGSEVRPTSRHKKKPQLFNYEICQAHGAPILHRFCDICHLSDIES